MSSKAAVIVATLGFALAAGAVQAAGSPWLLRLRATHLSPADKSTPVGGAGAANRISVESRTIPEVDIS